MADDEDEDLPEELTCPILFTLMRDPVVCVGDGRVYDRDGLVRFWRFRPLADFHGGPTLANARMRPALEARCGVQRWLAAHPGTIPDGWSDGACRQSSQAELDKLSAEIDKLAASRRAADAAEAAMAAGAAGGHAQAAAAAQLARHVAKTIRLLGPTPRGWREEWLGTYDQLVPPRLYAGRFAYVRRGDPSKMIWHADNGFWHVGDRINLGLQTGWMIVADAAAAPEHIVAGWQVEAGGAFVAAPRVRCVTDGAVDWDLGDTDDSSDGGEFAGGFAGGGGGGHGDDGERGHDAAGSDADSDGDDAEAAAAEEAAEEAEEEAAEADHARLFGAPRVALQGVLPRSLSEARWRECRGFLGVYVACEEEEDGGGGGGGGGGAARRLRLVHGRRVYRHADDRRRMLWWAGGFWHAGVAADVGRQRGSLIARDAAHLPEEVGAARWQAASDGPGGWTAAPLIACVLAAHLDAAQRFCEALPKVALGLGLAFLVLSVEFTK